MRRFLRYSLGIICVCLAGGCSPKAEQISIQPVSGQVIYDGRPAVGVRVFLYPTSAPGVPLVPVQPHGTTDTEGRFKLGTYATDDGAAEGGYQVVLFWPSAQTDDSEEESDEDRLLGWYSATQTKISVQIIPGENRLPVWNLPVMKAAPKEGGEGIPGRN